MAKRQIKQAANNAERQQTYTYQLNKYKKAMKEGIYFEALMIVYSMLEDRLKSFLYYSGVLDTRNGKIVPANKNKTELKYILLQKYGEREKFCLSKIIGKIRLIRAIVEWSSLVELNVENASAYMICLKSAMEDIDMGGVLSVLDELEPWLQYRNEAMHAAMNKNVNALYENLPDKVAQGMAYARYIDSQVKILKKSNKVRRAMKMQNN